MRFLKWLRQTFQTRRWVREQSAVWAERHYKPDHRQMAATVAAILVDLVHIDLHTVSPWTRFVEDLQMDDFEPFELLMAVEEHFHLTIAEEDATLLTTVGGLIKYVLDRRSDDSQPAFMVRQCALRALSAQQRTVRAKSAAHAQDFG